MSVSVIVVALTLSLTDVVAYQSSVHNINFPDAARSGRYRRSEPMPMTSQQIQTIVDRHNELRSGEGADNMEQLTYNESLAQRAEDWAAQCNFTHPTEELTPLNLGQNIHAATNLRQHPNPRWAIQHWFDEKAVYDYDTLACNGPMCGHYTQVVWATTRSIGCAYHRCLPLKRTAYVTTAASYFVCYYWPGGNYAGAKPYTKGPPCSKCSGGAGWCTTGGLCNWQCSGPGKNCSCAAVCYNCATVDLDTCRCSCADGWRGKYCTLLCRDTNSQCNAVYPQRGWYPRHCNDDNFKTHVRNICPAMCNLCTEDASATLRECPPTFAVVEEKDEKNKKDKDERTEKEKDKDKENGGNRGPSDLAQTMFFTIQQATLFAVVLLYHC